MSSFLIDTNIYIYAADASLPENPKAREIVDRAGQSGDVWCLTWQNVFEFMAIVTNPRAFQGRVLTLKEAGSFMGEIFSAPNLRLLKEGEDHWEIFLEVARVLPGLYGPFLYDCHLAALLKEHGVRRIVTADKGFGRFSFLEVINPFERKHLTL